jgi:hypothetical protein
MRSTTVPQGFWPWPPAGPQGPPGPPGGGSFRGTTAIYSGAYALAPASTGIQVNFSEWTSTPYASDQLAPAIAPGTADPVLAGWYQIRWELIVQFANPDEFPLSVRFEQRAPLDDIGLVADLGTYEFDVPAGYRPREGPGTQASLTTGVFFQPQHLGTATINPHLFWDGEPEVDLVYLTGEVSKFGDPVGSTIPAGGSGSVGA